MKIIEDITNFIFVESMLEKADILFIPGGTNPKVAERAAVLWKQGYAQRILPSGLYSINKTGFQRTKTDDDRYGGTYESEWAFLKDVLINNGVDEHMIMKEDQSRYTYQNALMSRQAVDEAHLQVDHAILCCKAFHARRCLMYYQLCFPKTTFYIAPVESQNINKDNWFKTAQGIEQVLGELERCGGQFKEILETNLLQEL